MRTYKRLLVDSETHTRLKTISAMTGRKLTECLEDISIEKTENIGLKPVKKEVRGKKYGFKI